MKYEPDCNLSTMARQLQLLGLPNCSEGIFILVATSKVHGFPKWNYLNKGQVHTKYATDVGMMLQKSKVVL